MGFLSGIQNFSLSPPGSRLRGTQETRLYTVYGSRSGSVARALGAQSREIWQGTTGSVSDQLEPTGPIQTPTTSCFHYHLSAVLIQAPQQPSKARKPRRYSNRASSFCLCESH